VTVQRTAGTAKRAVVGVSLRSGCPKYISSGPRDPLNEDIRVRRRCSRDP